MKMISLLTLGAAFFLAASVSLAGLETVSKERAESLKKAFLVQDLKCNHLNMYAVNSNVEKAYSVRLDLTGTQPAIVYATSLSVEKSEPAERVLIEVTTDKNFQKVEFIRFKKQRWQDVNLGTLVEPQFGKDYVTYETGGCYPL